MAESPEEIVKMFQAYCKEQENTVHTPRREADQEAQARRDLASGAAIEERHFK